MALVELHRPFCGSLFGNVVLVVAILAQAAAVPGQKTQQTK